ncbi:MAG: hypothetical protein HWN66_08380 [Candidatus Helarchaeota archaeon]|nr:hypothetical protein [Candidatus Helarchaeota archaeon]
MRALKLIGGVLTSFCGAFLLIITLININILGYGDDFIIAWILNLIIAILTLGGGFIVLIGKRTGGTLSLATGLLSITLGLIYWTTANPKVGEFWQFWQFSFFAERLKIGLFFDNLFFGISLEAILITAGSILVLAKGAD